MDERPGMPLNAPVKKTEQNFQYQDRTMKMSILLLFVLDKALSGSVSMTWKLKEYGLIMMANGYRIKIGDTANQIMQMVVRTL